MDPGQHEVGGHGTDDVGIVGLDGGRGEPAQPSVLAVLAAAMLWPMKRLRLSAP